MVSPVQKTCFTYFLKILFTTAGIIFLSILSAQEKTLRFEQISINDGLPDHSAQAFHQDRAGFYWIGTQNGLVRFDGYEMKLFHLPPPDSSHKKRKWTAIVRAIAEGPDGDIWIGTVDSKLVRFDRQREKMLVYLSEPWDSLQVLKSPVKALHVDRAGIIWAGTQDGCVLRLVPGKKPDEGHLGKTRSWQLFTRKDFPILGAGIREIFPDHQGRLWITTSAGLARWVQETNAFQPVPLVPAGSNKSIVNLNKATLAPDGTFWLSSLGHGIIHFDPKTGSTHQYLPDSSDSEGLLSAEVGPIFYDSQGVLWFGINQLPSIRLQRFIPESQSFQPVNILIPGKTELVFGVINTIKEDFTGNLWVGFHNGGMLKYSREEHAFHWRQSNPSNPGSLSHNYVSSIAADTHGDIWVGTGDGLNLWDAKSGSFRQYRKGSPPGNGLPHNKIYYLGKAKDEKFWISTRGGIAWYDPGRDQFIPIEKLFPQTADLDQIFIQQLDEDKDGNFWMATTDGLYFLNKKTGALKTYPSDPEASNGLKTNALEDVKVDRSGKVWIGTSNLGFYCFDPKTEKFRYFDYSPGRSPIVDRAGNIWMGTYSDGLLKIDPEDYSIRQFLQSDGLAHDKVRVIVEDERGRLWIGTEHGLSCYDPEQDLFRNFFASDGLPSNRFISRAGWKSPQGVLFLGTDRGLVYFHPDSIQLNIMPPRLVFTEFKLLGGSTRNTGAAAFSFDDPIRLKYWQNDLAVHYAAIHSKNPQKHQYLVKLENYDNDWRQVGTRRVANYTNLEPGHYTFQVKASNSDGIWNEAGRSLDIIITPPWWATSWAYALYLVLIAGSLYSLYRFQLRRQLEQAEAQQIKKLEAAKSRFYTNITHEFRTPLTVISGMTRQIKADPQKWYHHGMEMIQRNAQRLLLLVNQLLDFAKLESGNMPLKWQNGDIIGYLSYLLQSFQSLAASKNIDLQFQKEQDKFYMDYDPDKLEKVVFNLLSNAIKYSPAGGKVTLSVSSESWRAGDYLRITVQDTGIGIPASYLPRIFDRFYQVDESLTKEGEGTGIGLALTRELLHLMGGAIQVKSRVGKGSEFVVTLPIHQNSAAVSAAPPKMAPDLSGLSGFMEPNSPPSSPTGPGFSKAPPQNSRHPLALLIEDNPDVITYLKSCLADQYRIETASNGQRGIEKALKLVPDIIISDVMMPKMDGFDLCKTLKEDDRTSHIPIILLTAKADRDARVEGLSRGADAYLTKPFHKEELEIRLEKLIELRRKLQERYQNVIPVGKEDESPFPQEDAFMLRLHQVVHQNLNDETFGIKELSAALFISRVQLYRKVRALTGKTVAQVIYSIKLDHARQLLLHSQKRVGEVAFETGFKDSSYFTKLYKKHFGELPSETVQQSSANEQ